MHSFGRLKVSFVAALCMFLSSSAIKAQMPFYTDDPAVTENRVVHFEFYNEFDGLQSSQFPNINQNTANLKLNFGLPRDFEFDIDAPFIRILRTDGNQNSAGAGDTELGLKWQALKSIRGSHRPAVGASIYFEVPTGNVREQLGSGMADYWLNTIVQEPFTDSTRITANIGFLFAGNTSTGVLGLQTSRGHVYTGGLSLLHDYTDRVTLGAEAYGGFADASGLGRNQLQGLVGGAYRLRSDVSLTFALMGGKYEASPRIGGQVGFAVDFPRVGGRRE